MQITVNFNQHDDMFWVDEATGFQCAIIRVLQSGLGHLCGYVQIPEDHPAFRLDYSDELLEHISVHGGITWASGLLPSDAAPNGWWLGFDCAHSGDALPLAKAVSSYETIRDMNYVISECQALAEQLAAMRVSNKETIDEN